MKDKLTPLSYSSLKEFMKSPAHFIAYKNRVYKESPAMRLGTAVHAALLEPDKFKSDYDTTPLRKGTKAYKELDGSKIWLNSSDWATVQGIKRKLKLNVEAADLLATCELREVEVKGDINGIPFRGFVDATYRVFLNAPADYKEQDIIIDIKTTQDASPEGFARSVYNYSYHLQAAIYTELTGAKQFYIIAIESSSPYSVVIYNLSQDALDSGYAMLQRGIEAFKNWDGSETGYENYHQIDLPRWAK